MGELVHHLQPCLPPLSCHAAWKVTEFVRKSAVRDNVRLSIWVIVSIPHCTCKLFSALSTCVGVVSKLINVEMKSRCQQAAVSGPIRTEPGQSWSGQTFIRHVSVRSDVSNF